MEKDIVLLLTGFVVGAMNAIAGGGMLVGFPMMISLGTPALLANATTGVVTLPGQMASAWGYRRYLRKVPVRYALFIVPVFVGAFLGSTLLKHTSSAHFADIVPGLVLFGVVLFALQPYLHFHLHQHVKGKRRSWLPMVLLGLALVPLSFYGGYFGAGYGFMMLAFLGFTNLPDAHMMNGMKNIAATFVGLAAILCLWSTQLIQWRIGLIMAVGSVIGGYCGARGAQKVSGHWLRLGIICIGLGAVVYLALHDY